MNGLPALLRWTLETLALALVYVIAGKVGQALALPHSNVTLLWPPSGIALAAVLGMGARSLPGLWIGAVVVNGWDFLALAAPPPTETLALASAIMGLGSILQPYVGALAVRRFSDPGNPLSTVRAGAAFIGLAPLICLVSASIGSSGLLGTGLIPLEQWQTTFATWWIGDTIGLLIFAPFTLLLWRMTLLRQSVLVGVIGAGFLVTYIASSSLRDQSTKVWETRSDRTTEQLTSTFLLWLDLSYSSVHGMTALFSGSGEVSEDEFLDVVDSLEAAQGAYFPSSLAYAQRPEDAESWNILLSTDDQGQLATDNILPADTPLARVLDTAWADPGTMHITIGVGEAEERLMFTAVRADSQEQEGVLIATINLTTTLDGLFTRPDAQGLKLRMTGETRNSNGGIESLLLYGPLNANPATVRSVPFRTVSGSTVFDFKWDVAPDFAGGPDYDLANAVLIGGIISTVLADLFIMFLLLQNESVEARVRERTEEVSRKTKLLQAVMGSMNQGIAAYDQDLVMIAFNERFLKIRGYPESMIHEGQTFEALIRYDVESHEFGDGDPEEIFQEKVQTARQFHYHQFERKRPNGQYIEVQGGPIPGGGFVSTYSDITERKITEEQIEHQVQELDKARRATLNMMADAEAARRELQAVLNEMSASITYASRIQRSVLPDPATLDSITTDHFVIWEPRDVVGGDIYWALPWGAATLITLGDCTGHGVPGAFMTLISTGALERALLDVPPGDLGRLISLMHQLVQTTLGQESEGGDSDDGIELGMCYLTPGTDEMLFAGARFDLFKVRGDQVEVTRGTKAGLGYRGIPQDQTYDTHRIEGISGSSFYMTSDGLIDQVGGTRRRAFGKKRLMNLLIEIHPLPMDEQKARLRQALADYQGKEVRRDDVSVVGFRL
ncbi:hypothetical protein JCM17960_32060 [Magnetospira thiophila]